MAIKDMARRFWSKVEECDQGGCWIWTGALDRHGYGRFGRTSSAHRVSWEMANRPLIPGEVVMHNCDNPPCVNPAHLSVGTQADNLADMRRKGRGVFPKCPPLRGEANGYSKLTESDVRHIRALAGVVPQRTIAQKFSISPGQVSRIHTKKRWAHVAS